MKYTEKEQLQQIVLRGEIIRLKKENRTRGLLSAVSAAFLCALVSFVYIFAKKGVSETETVYGSFMISAETGGYVLVAILAFFAGITTVLLINLHRHKAKKNKYDKGAEPVWEERNEEK